MSQNALKAVATGKAPAEKRPTTIAGLMADPSIKAQMALALPKHMTADRLARIATTEIRKVPKLMQCDQHSFLGAIMQCAQLGLEPGSALGHAYLIPFENRKRNITEVQFIIGYRGMIDLARRSGQIMSIEARSVYEADHFDVSFGLDSKLEHKPAWETADRGELRFVYAVAKLKDGGVQFEVMSRADIEKVRAQSKAGSSGPWVTHFEEMAKKTVIRRLFKYLPVSIEMARAVTLDEQAETGIQQDNDFIIDGESSEVDSNGEPDEPAQAGTVVMEYSKVMDMMNKAFEAKDIDQLNTAADLIKSVSSKEQRVELRAEYNSFKSKIEAA